jgi:hypothetical protein
VWHISLHGEGIMSKSIKVGKKIAFTNAQVAAGLACATALLAFTENSSAAYTWAAGDGNWNVSGDWNGGSPGTAGVAPTYINNGHKVTVSDAEPGNSNTQYLYLNTNNGGLSTDGSGLIVTTGGNLTWTNNIGVGAGASVNITNSSGDGTTVGGTLFSNASFQSVISFGNTTTTTSTGSPLTGVSALNVSAGSLNISNNGVGGFLEIGAGLNATGNLSSVGAASSINTGAQGSLILGDVAAATPNGTTVPVGNTGAGTFNQSGGTLTSPYVQIGLNAPGTYNLSGGTLTAGDAFGRSMDVGPTNQGTFSMTGGAATVTLLNIGIGAHNDTTPTSATKGQVQISGGSYTGSVITVGNTANTGTGSLEVTGNTSTIAISSGLNYPVMSAHANSTLQFDIGPGGVTAISANSTSTLNPNEVLQLTGTLDLDLINGANPAVGTKYNLITTNITAKDTGSTGNNNVPNGTGFFGIDDMDAFGSATPLALAPADVGFWSFAVVPTLTGNTTTGYALQATLIQSVPEPTSLGILVCGGAMAVRRGRRRAMA